jgi:hypothetical protein
MNTTTHTTIHTFEGFSYVEFNGEFFKGCRRCGGTGHYSFDGFDSLCYMCRNTSAKLGEPLESKAAAEKWCHERAVRRAQRERKQEQVRLAKLARRDAAWDALEAAHPAVWAFLTSIVNVRDWNKPEGNVYPAATERDQFVLSMVDKLWSLDEVGFSPRQLEVLETIAAKRVARQEEAAAHPVPAGRQVVTGEVLSAKVVEGDYGTAYKITVKDDRGFRIYCSLPKAQADEAYNQWVAEIDGDDRSIMDYGYAVWFLGTEVNGETKYGIKGRRITFTATLEQSSDDVSFGFGSRPSKGSWL